MEEMWEKQLMLGMLSKEKRVGRNTLASPSFCPPISLFYLPLAES